MTLSELPSVGALFILSSCLIGNESDRISTAALHEHPYMNLNHPLTVFPLMNNRQESGFSPSKLKSMIKNRLSKVPIESKLCNMV